MRVTVCGTRGSTPAPGPDFVRYGGHTSCIAIAHEGFQSRRARSRDRREISYASRAIARAGNFLFVPRV